ncbi:transposase [Gluconobacter oxydans]|uniref:transposase n=1 Tax=Gluconobacter oxydans TaxID=442 RepID=UPI0039E8AE40
MTGSIGSTAPRFVPIHRPRAQRGTHSEAFGRSRGGFTSKVHTRCDNQGRPLGFLFTGGQVSDYKAVNALMALSVPNPRAMVADRGYDSDCFRQDRLIHGILPVIPSRKGRIDPLRQDRLVFMSFLNLAAARFWLRSFINVT